MLLFGKKKRITQIVVPSDNGEQWAINERNTLFDKGMTDDEYNEIRKEVYKKQADNGDRHAMYWYALLIQGDDKKASESWYRRAAELGDVDAMKALGLFYSEYANGEYDSVGYGFGYNEEYSLFWYKKAAAAGDLDAVHKLELFYGNQ